MTTRSLFLILIAGMLLVVPVSADYVLQVEALTSSPGDGATVYFGNTPAVPTVVGGRSPVQIPVAGTLTTAEIYDYSGTAGTAEVYQYFVIINNQTSYRIANLSVSANERVFSNTSMGIAVNAGDFFEIQRIHPTWATNPATNIVGGYVEISTETPGYALWGQALTHTPGNNTITYFGGRPVAPSTAVMTNKIYVPAEGSITSVYIDEYAGTAGTANESGYFLERDGGSETPIMNVSSATNQRLYNNTNLNFPVAPGSFIEFKRRNPQYRTNPATNIVGASAFVSTAGSSTLAGYPVWVQTLTSTPADGATAYFGNRPIATSTTAGTNKIYIRKNGTITRAEIYYYAGTAGSSEPWSLYVRKNNTEDFLICTNSISASERLFKNLNINIPVVSGDYIEIKSVQPIWATDVKTAIAGGYVWLEYGQPSASTEPPQQVEYVEKVPEDLPLNPMMSIVGLIIIVLIARTKNS